MPTSYSYDPHMRGLPSHFKSHKGERPMGRSTGNINARSRGGSQEGPKTASDLKAIRSRTADRAERKGGGGQVSEGGIQGGWRSWKRTGF